MVNSAYVKLLHIEKFQVVVAQCRVCTSPGLTSDKYNYWYCEWSLVDDDSDIMAVSVCVLCMMLSDHVDSQDHTADITVSFTADPPTLSVSCSSVRHKTCEHRFKNKQHCPLNKLINLWERLFAAFSVWRQKQKHFLGSIWASVALLKDHSYTDYKQIIQQRGTVDLYTHTRTHTHTRLLLLCSTL